MKEDSTWKHLSYTDPLSSDGYEDDLRVQAETAIAEHLRLGYKDESLSRHTRWVVGSVADGLIDELYGDTEVSIDAMLQLMQALEEHLAD